MCLFTTNVLKKKPLNKQQKETISLGLVLKILFKRQEDYKNKWMKIWSFMCQTISQFLSVLWRGVMWVTEISLGY